MPSPGCSAVGTVDAKSQLATKCVRRVPPDSPLFTAEVSPASSVVEGENGPSKQPEVPAFENRQDWRPNEAGAVVLATTAWS